MTDFRAESEAAIAMQLSVDITRGEPTPIAIIATACRVPGAHGTDALWDLLCAGRDAVTEIPAWRWAKPKFYHPEPGQPGKIYSYAAGIIDHLDRFDASFFDISPREAEQIDPQQRLLLELTYEALLNGGLTRASLRGTDTGVYIGGSSWDYLTRYIGDPAVTDAHTLTGTILSVLSNRISHTFDLRGPSLTVDTACSSALVALDMACEALRSDQISMAVVGGVNALLSPQPFVAFCRAGMLSRAGHCHAFDERADGYVRSEGGGIAILKRLDQAVADGDDIRAVIWASGVNSDGRSTGISMPNVWAQTALLERVYAEAGIDPDALSYVEAHGTGTPVGDPIEARAIGEALGRKRSAALPIGSVKSNVGHLEAASGMVGLFKAMLIAERGQIPRSIHSETPNPAIPFEDLNLRLAQEAGTLERTGSEVFVGVNSFGIGGTNAHVILSGYDTAKAPTGQDEPGRASPPLLLSAASEEALRDLARVWRAQLVGGEPAALDARVRGAALRRDHLPHRLVSIAADAKAHGTVLDAFLEGSSSSALSVGFAKGEAPVAFVFSGNGSQWPGMGLAAMAASPAFRTGVEEAEAALEPHLNWKVIDALRAEDPRVIAETTVAQPVLFALQVGVVQALRAGGVRPSVHFGHSVGEVAAAWSAGALTLTDAAKVIAARSIGQRELLGSGTMGVLAADPDAAEALLAAVDSRLEIAAENSSRAVAVSGPRDAIGKLATEARKRRMAFAPLEVEHAFHSSAMDAIRGSILRDMSSVTPRTALERFVSTVTGEDESGEGLGAEYWWRNVRAKVRFAPVARKLAEEGIRIFVEIGPQAILRSHLSDAIRKTNSNAVVLSTLSKQTTDDDPFRKIAADCFALGHDITGAEDFAGPCEWRGLPSYPWQRESYWVAPTAEAEQNVALQSEHPLLGFAVPSADGVWLNHLSIATHGWLRDHKVEGQVVVPAAAIVDIALAAARVRTPNAAALEISDLRITAPLLIEGDLLREARFEAASSGRTFQFETRPRFAEAGWVRHASGTFVDSSAPRDIEKCPIAAAGLPVLDAADIYDRAEALGLSYGSGFRRLRSVTLDGPAEAWVSLEPDSVSHSRAESGYGLDPALLDAAFHGLLGFADTAGSASPRGPMVPWQFGRIQLVRFGILPTRARIRVRARGRRSLCADFSLFGADGLAVAYLSECWFVEIGQRSSSLQRHANRALVFSNRAAALSFTPTVSGRGISLGDEGGGTPAGAGTLGLLADAYISSVNLHVLTQLSSADGRILDGASLARTGGVHPTSVDRIDRLIADLMAEGVLVRDGDDVRVADGEGLPEPDLILRTLLNEAPDAVAEVSLLAAAGDGLRETLRSGVAPTPAGALLDQIFTVSPTARFAAERLTDSVVRLIGGAAIGRAVRVLELGAGRGTLTRALLSRLSDMGVEADYIALTASSDLRALSDAIAFYPSARAVEWDALAGTRGLDLPFDLVLGSHAFAGGRVPTDVLARITGWIGGELCLIEPGHSGLLDFLGFDRGGLSGAATMQGLESSLRYAGCSIAERIVDGPGWPLRLFRVKGEGKHNAGNHAAAPSGVAVVSATGDAFSQALVVAFAGAGLHCRHIALSDADGVPWGSLAAEQVLFVVPEEVEAGVASASQWLAELAENVVLLDGDHARLMLVVRADAVGDTAASALTAFARVLCNEAPNLQVRTVRLGSDLSSSARIEALVAEVIGGDGEPEIFYSIRGREVRRAEFRTEAAARRPEGPVRLEAVYPGLLNSLRWASVPPRELDDEEVEIDVEAAGLNFRDVMWAGGLLPDEALLNGFAGAGLGLECAGTVRAVGRGVTDLGIGDRVMALAPAALSSRVVTKRHAVSRLPSHLDFADGATIPVAFLTVAYALGRLAQLAPGERVLVHGGAGAVGLAALQYAKDRGAVVYMTAGSEPKRALLRALGADAVFNSRDLSFVDDVRAVTSGEGVDVVLNSLSGEAMERSLGLLRSFGRFLELGKRDLYQNTQVGLRPLRNNVSYFAVDADQLAQGRPRLAADLLEEVIGLFNAGRLRPLPRRVFSFADVEDAFRLMQASGHIGKIVLTPGSTPLRLAPSAYPFTLAADGTALVVGGVSGFGLATARWLVEKGVRAVALLSRRGSEAPDAEAAIATLANAGAAVRIFACDVTETKALADILRVVREEMPPIRWVVHAAMTIDDGLIPQIDAARFENVLLPKWSGAENLDRLTRDDPLELFLMFSSIAAAVGNPGQANYAAANAAMEAIAERRRADGRPALTVQWGAISDVGYLARDARLRDALMRRAGAHLTATEALQALPDLLALNTPVVSYAELDWAAARSQLPLLASPLFDVLRESKVAATTGDSLLSLITGRDRADATRAIGEALAQEVASVLKLPAERIDLDQPLTELGMDSLMMVELRLAVETRFGASIPMFSLTDAPTLRKIAVRLAETVIDGAAEDETGAEDLIARHEGLAISPSSVDSSGSDARAAADRAARAAAE